MQLPIGAREADFKGVVDLVRMKAIVWARRRASARSSTKEIPADLKAKAEEWRARS
jgi:elongation factor G